MILLRTVGHHLSRHIFSKVNHSYMIMLDKYLGSVDILITCMSNEQVYSVNLFSDASDYSGYCEAMLLYVSPITLITSLIFTYIHVIQIIYRHSATEY